MKLQLFPSHPLAASLSLLFFGWSLEMRKEFEDDFENYVEYLTECSMAKYVKSTFFISLGKLI